MKKTFRFMKAVMLTLMVAVMFLGTNTITANAQTMIPGCMKVAEDGRIEIQDCGHTSFVKDASGRIWDHASQGYPFCYYDEITRIEQRKYFEAVITTRYLDCYLTDYIRSHDESEWPSFIIKGSDGIPFYYCDTNADENNYVVSNNGTNWYFVKYCYDANTGFWVQDKSYKGPYVAGVWGTGYVKTVTMEELIAQTKEDIANGKVVNGKAKTPVQPPFKDKLIDSETGEKVRPVTPSNPVDPPTEGGEITDPYADENTLGATVTIATDCIKVKTNKKGIVAQKPLPKAVKVGTKALKRNKTFVVSYEKYDDGWYATDAIMDEGIYRLVITGQNGYEGVYKKRLYVTADKTIKAMSSVAIKVNKVPYSGEPITSGVIKSVKVGKRTLEEGTDYTATYKNNLDSGTGQVTLTAIEGSGVLGTKTVNFAITGNKMNKVKVTGLKALVYDPNAQMVQNMSDVQLTYAGGQLTEGTDFTLTYANNVKAGTAKMVFTGKGLYNGTLTKTFKITKMPLNVDMLDEASKNIELTYTKKALKPEVKLTVGGTELKKNIDYTLAYSNNVKVSTETKPAWIVVKGKGNYAGSFKVSFTIIPKVDDTVAKPNAGVNTVMTEEISEEDDTVSGNSVEDETPETDDTVSGNDIADDTVSENDAADDADKSEEAETTDATDKSDEGEITDATDKSDEDKIIDDRNTDNESADDAFRNDESVVFETKPIGFVVCDCGCIMPFYTYGMSDVENEIWSAHLYEHTLNGWQVHYNSVSYEKALKRQMISEDSDGRWTLLQGTLLMPSEVKAEETEETQIEETEESAVEETEESQIEETEESAVEETEKSEVEIDSDKPVGEGMDYIENDF